MADRPDDEVKKDMEKVYGLMRERGPAWKQMVGSVLFFALKREGQEAMKEKALKYFEGLSADEILEFCSHFNDEPQKAVAKVLFVDPRFQ